MLLREDNQDRAIALDETFRTRATHRVSGVVHFRHAPPRHIETTYIAMQSAADDAPRVLMVSWPVMSCTAFFSHAASATAPSTSTNRVKLDLKVVMAGYGWVIQRGFVW